MQQDDNLISRDSRLVPRAIHVTGACTGKIRWAWNQRATGYGCESATRRRGAITKPTLHPSFGVTEVPIGAGVLSPDSFRG